MQPRHWLLPASSTCLYSCFSSRSPRRMPGGERRVVDGRGDDSTLPGLSSLYRGGVYVCCGCVNVSPTMWYSGGVVAYGAMSSLSWKYRLRQIRCNSCAILDDDFNHTGAGIYPRMALLNHDCRPNCVAVFQGPAIVVRAIAPISPGDEITICYVDAMKPCHLRRYERLLEYSSHVPLIAIVLIVYSRGFRPLVVQSGLETKHIYHSSAGW